MSRLLAVSLAVSLVLPTGTVLAAPPETPEAESESAVDSEPPPPSSGVGGDYGETVDYDWDGSEAPPPPSTGPRVDIDVHNGIRPVYLQRVGAGEPVEVCEAPCGVPIGDASGQFIIGGPGRRASKPFTLGSANAYQLQIRGGNPKRRSLGIALFPITGVVAIVLAVVPTRLNMPFGAGVAMWAGAGVVAVAGISSGMVLIRFSRTQVKVLPAQ
jgi:hypothetical protein